jgi:hypothetical protein
MRNIDWTMITLTVAYVLVVASRFGSGSRTKPAERRAAVASPTGADG